MEGVLFFATGMVGVAGASYGLSVLMAYLISKTSYNKVWHLDGIRLPDPCDPNWVQVSDGGLTAIENGPVRVCFSSGYVSIARIGELALDDRYARAVVKAYCGKASAARRAKAKDLLIRFHGSEPEPRSLEAFSTDDIAEELLRREQVL